MLAKRNLILKSEALQYSAGKGDDRCRKVIVQPGEVTGVQCGTGRLSVRKITPRFSSGKKILTGRSLLELFSPGGKESGL